MNGKMQVDCLHLGMATIARRPIKQVLILGSNCNPPGYKSE